MPANAQLNQLDTLLLLALSSSTNLVISSRAPITALQSYILSFCARPSISRTAHAVLPDATASERAETSRDGLLRATFVDNKTRQLPQVLIAPGLDEYPNTVQRATYEALRDQRFTLDEETHNLPRRFVLVGIVEDYARMSNQLVRLVTHCLLRRKKLIWRLTDGHVRTVADSAGSLEAHKRAREHVSTTSCPSHADAVRASADNDLHQRSPFRDTALPDLAQLPLHIPLHGEVHTLYREHLDQAARRAQRPAGRDGDIPREGRYPARRCEGHLCAVRDA